MSLKNAVIVHGHKIDEALELSDKPAAVVSQRDGRPITGDVGRLMPDWGAIDRGRVMAMIDRELMTAK